MDLVERKTGLVTFTSSQFEPSVRDLTSLEKLQVDHVPALWNRMHEGVRVFAGMDLCQTCPQILEAFDRCAG